MKIKIFQIHLLLASFVMPAVLLISISGGLYLFGFKGNSNETEIKVSNQFVLDIKSQQLEEDVEKLLRQLGIETEFEYLKIKGTTITTRPTSRSHLKIIVSKDDMKIWKVQPSFQKTLIELHKGHGPLLFKVYQKLVAISLIVILLSGLWMGLSNKRMRTNTLLAIFIGTATFFLLALA